MKTVLLVTTALTMAAPVFAQCVTPTAPSGSGGFSVSGGQIIGPNGQPFKAQGIDILESTLGAAVGDASGGALLQDFPNTNMVRIAMESGYQSYTDATFVNAVNWLTAKGIVVEIGNYDAPTQSVSTGSQLTDEVNWYTALATIYKGNPYVWFSTDNEPTDTYSGLPAGSVTAEQVAVYNAIRATGSNSMVGLEPIGGGGSLNPSAYTDMTDVHWDQHYYNWETGYSTDVGVNEAKLETDLAPLQESFHSADGVIPAIVGEFGNATDGTNVDPGGAAAVQAVLNGFSGWTAWLFYWPGDMTGDELTNQGNGWTEYGQQIAAGMTAAPRTQQSCAPKSAVAVSTQPVGAMTAQQAAPILADLNGQIASANAQLTATGTTLPPPAAAPSSAATAPSPTVSSQSSTAALEQQINAALAGLGLTATFSPITSSSPTSIVTRGQSVATDAGGNTFSVDTSGDVIENGSTVPGGGDTSAVTTINGVLFGQDSRTGQWFILNQQGDDNWWTPNAAPLDGLPATVVGQTTRVPVASAPAAVPPPTNEVELTTAQQADLAAAQAQVNAIAAQVAAAQAQLTAEQKELTGLTTGTPNQ